MRIISGFLKGKEIKGYTIEGTRPTMDRVKESLFGTIQNYVKESTVLDLFAGSGNLGIEAISNGAKYCYFVDNNIEVIKHLKKTTTNFNISDKCQIIKNDYVQALNYFKQNCVTFDLIFVDPPYKYQIIDEIIKNIMANNLLNAGGLIILEYQDDSLEPNYQHLKLIKHKKYGNKYLSIYQKLID